MTETNQSEIADLRKKRRKALVVAGIAFGLGALFLLAGKAYLESATSQGEGIQRMSLVGVILFPVICSGIISVMIALILHIQLRSIKNLK